MTLRIRFLVCASLLNIPAFAAAAPDTQIAQSAPANPEAKLYDPARNAAVDVDAALIRAAASDKRVIVVMGANWCHDSIGLAGWFETPRFKAMMSPKYELVYVDVGTPQTGHGRNLDIAKRFHASKIKGTPTVLILSSQGQLLNKNDAGSWRNAASRSEEDIFAYFAAAQK